MSASLYIRPAPIEVDDWEYIDELRYLIRDRFDAMPGNPLPINRAVHIDSSRETMAWLEGIADVAGPDLKEHALKMLNMLRANKQGVHIMLRS